MIELDILIEEIELSNMSRVSKKYVYENLLDIRQKITKQLTLCDVVASLPSKDEKLIGNMCLSYRHDFGLLSKQERTELMNECRNWLISYEKNRK